MVVVIMAGGIGSRFWPRSRTKSPKHLLSITTENTMLENTIKRAESITSKDKIYVVTSSNQVEMVKEKSSILEENIISEPFGKNTAAAIGLAAIHLEMDEVMVVLPADHYVRNVERFSEIINKGKDHIENEAESLVTIGIEPTHPETGYGYIQLGEEIDSNMYKVENFAEKPNLKTAIRFIENGDFIWNSGIFLWKVSTILSNIKTHLPDLYENLIEIKESIGTNLYNSVLGRVYKDIRSISIDYGIMEKATNVKSMRGDFGWSDVGSWFELHRFKEKDSNGNVASDNFISIDTQNCYIYSDDSDKLITTIGVENIAIIDTKDAMLVTDLSKSQEVKTLVDKLKAKDLNKYL
ncbi:MAG: mannose-1-phosphate guanylyltransferase [Candidatus Delongbacteria bacterium]|nr:MAG: mannose-1-phosphate guanylyltransferase [Candidatus Delongbacteria bacterium]